MAAQDPLSPEFDRAYVDSYTPSNEPQGMVDLHGRRRLRMNNGQDPEKHPEKFTPPPAVVRVVDVWPTNEEVYAWAEPGRKKRAAYNIRMREEAEKMKKLKTPSGAAGSSSTPITDETAAAAINSYAGPALPIQL